MKVGFSVFLNDAIPPELQLSYCLLYIETRAPSSLQLRPRLLPSTRPAELISIICLSASRKRRWHFPPLWPILLSRDKPYCERIIFAGLSRTGSYSCLCHSSPVALKFFFPPSWTILIVYIFHSHINFILWISIRYIFAVKQYLSSEKPFFALYNFFI